MRDAARAEDPARDKPRAPRKPDGVDRRDSSGLTLRGLKDPKDLDARGRGKFLPAFPQLLERVGMPGPKGELAEISEANLNFYLLGVSNRGTPAVVGAMVFGVHPATVSRWLAEGRAEDCKDPAKREFARRTDQAYAYARAGAEFEVGAKDPAFALSRGPLGRTTREVPGWSDERRIALTDPDGNPATFVLKLAIGEGYATTPVLPEPRDVTPDQDGEE